MPPSIPRPTTPTGMPPATAHRSPSRYHFGVVCSSNINRSMEAHLVLGNAGLSVSSYGTGTHVRLPGKTALEPRIFKFGAPYADMVLSLAATAEDEAFFTRNGVLPLARRGAAVKRAPERWQDLTTERMATHDVVIAFEERIFDAVVEELQNREPTIDLNPVHVLCLDTKDNPHEAALQGQVALDLCWRLEQCDDLQAEAAEIIQEFEAERLQVTPIKLLYQVCYL